MTHLIATAMLAATLLGLPAGAMSPQANVEAQDSFRPGQDGVDLAAITGLRGSHEGRLPACADPARRGELRPC